jgi:CheY-like chemotaxis protein
MQQAAMQHRSLETRSPSPAQSRKKAGQRAPTIVLADDSILQRMTMRALLEAEGYQVLEAGDGREVIDLARMTRPDLILMDVAMPTMDGVTTARRIRQAHDAISRVPIVFVTALSAAVDRETALEAGGSDYLVKPISQRELLRSVERHVKDS